MIDVIPVVFVLKDSIGKLWQFAPDVIIDVFKVESDMGVEMNSVGDTVSIYI